MRFNISSFITLLAAASTVVAQPTKPTLNPPLPRNPVDLTALPPVDISPVTNAKRFADGLPPLNPVKRRGPHRGAAYRHEGTRVTFAPRAETSATPLTNVKCNILVKTGGSTLGFISPVFNDYGEYGAPQGGQAGALEVSFPSNGAATGPIDLPVTNNADTINSFPYLSAAVGYMSDSDNLGPGSSNYVPITGNSGSTGSGATPSSSTSNSYATRTSTSANSETAIWTYDPATQNIGLVWTNTDGSSTPAQLVYFVDTDPSDGNANTLVATGDFGAFQGLFGCTDTCQPVTFTCVPPA